MENVEIILFFDGKKNAEQEHLEEWVFIESAFKMQCHIHKNTHSFTLLFLQFCRLGKAKIYINTSCSLKFN